MVYYPHIYFESKKPGKDAVFSAVKDVGRPGCKSAIEVAWVAVAMLRDYLDGRTKNHEGKTIKFTKRLWRGRYLILLRLAKRYGGIRVVKLVNEIRKLVDKGKLPKTKVKQVCSRCLKAKSVSAIVKLLSGLVKSAKSKRRRRR